MNKKEIKGPLTTKAHKAQIKESCLEAFRGIEEEKER